MEALGEAMNEREGEGRGNGGGEGGRGEGGESEVGEEAGRNGTVSERCMESGLRGVGRAGGEEKWTEKRRIEARVQ